MELEITEYFTCKRAKQYVMGLQKVIGEREKGAITDQETVNSIVHKSLQMLVSTEVIVLKEELNRRELGETIKSWPDV